MTTRQALNLRANPRLLAGRGALVEKDGLCYSCMETPLGWKCGACARGNLGFGVRLLPRCRVCKAKVCRD